MSDREGRILVYVMMLGAWELTQRKLFEQTDEQIKRRTRIADALDTLETMLSDEDIARVNEICS